MKLNYVSMLPFSLACVMASGQTITTPNLHLIEPPVGEHGWGPQVNANMSIIDAAVGALMNPYQGAWNATQSYTAGQFVLYQGSIYIATATNVNATPGLSATWQNLGSQSNVPAPGLVNTAPVSNGSGQYTLLGVLLSSQLNAHNGVAPLDQNGRVPTGNLPACGASGTGHQAGIAPDPGNAAGTTRFLREDCTWAVPPGGGGSAGASSPLLSVQVNSAGALQGANFGTDSTFSDLLGVRNFTAQAGTFNSTVTGKYGDPSYVALNVNIQPGGTGSPCQPLGGLCTTTVGLSEFDIFPLPGQNLYDNFTGYCEGEPGDCVQDRYLYSNGGDAMTNAEGTWQQLLVGETHGNLTFTCSEGCTTGSESMTVGNVGGLGVNAIGIGRLIAAPAFWTGTGASPQTLTSMPFSQVQLPGYTTAASTFAEIGATTANGNSVTVTLSSAPHYGFSVTSTANFTVGSLVCLSIPPTAGLNNGNDYFGMARVTAMSSGSITFNHLDYQYPGGTIIATGGQGGCGYGMENVGVTSTEGALQIWPVLGALDANGTVLYPQQNNPNIVGNLGQVVVHAIAKVESAEVAPGNGSDTLVVSPNLAPWNTSDTVTESHGRSAHIQGLRLFVDQATPGSAANTGLEVSLAGWGAGRVDDRVLKLDIGQAFGGGLMQSFVEADGLAGYFATLNTTVGGFYFANSNCSPNPERVIGFAAGSIYMNYTCDSPGGTDFSINTQTAHFGKVYASGGVVAGNVSNFGNYSGTTQFYGFDDGTGGPNEPRAYGEMSVGLNSVYTQASGNKPLGIAYSFYGSRDFNSANPTDLPFFYMGATPDNGDSTICVEWGPAMGSCNKDSFEIGTSWTVNLTTGNTTLKGSATLTLAADPSAAMQAATKQYADAHRDPVTAFDVSYTPPASTSAFPTGSFTTVPLNTVALDTANGFNTSTSIYTVAVAGLYSCSSKLRWIDSSGAGVNFGQGVGTTNGDSSAFQWFTTQSGARQGSLNQRLITLAIGDQLRMFAFDDTTALQLSTAEMACSLVP